MTRIGIVCTNQHRKDFGLAAAVMARLTEELKGDVQFWIHTDKEIHYWSMPALIADFQLGEYVELTYPPVSDQELASRYRECTLTLHPGLGEGWGFPIFESLACDVPAIHGNYGGGASAMASCGLAHLLVEPCQWRLEGQFNSLRPVYSPEDWVRKVMELLSQPKQEYALHVAHLSWMKLGHAFKRWFREGLGNMNENQ
jgi:glycosyltransferase involved in cell wall biosynthesis